MDFPVDVRAISCAATSRRAVAFDALTIEPLVSIPEPITLATTTHDELYSTSGTAVFFLDDKRFAEPDAFWVAGARNSTVAIRPATVDRP